MGIVEANLVFMGLIMDILDLLTTESLWITFWIEYQELTKVATLKLKSQVRAEGMGCTWVLYRMEGLVLPSILWAQLSMLSTLVSSIPA